MFDPSPEIKKIERVAAKFSSAEEEAALRKKELTTLKQTNASRTVTKNHHIPYQHKGQTAFIHACIHTRE